MHATTDRGEIIHLAGRARLSPAVREGAPALVGPGDAAGRCGWEPFFRALSARGLAVAFDPDAPDAARLVPRGEAGRHPGTGHAGMLEEARRFVVALGGRPPGASP